MTANYRELYIGAGTHVLSETVSEDAQKVNEIIKLDAEYDDLTSSEKEKLGKQVFPPDLMFTVDVDLIHSKKAFLNFMKGLDDGAVYDQLWNLRPHNPNAYEAPIGSIDLSFVDIPPQTIAHKGGENPMAKVSKQS